MTIVPKNYNNGRKRKGVARPNFSCIRAVEQSIAKDRAVKGLYFSGTYEANEFGLKDVHKKRNKILFEQYAFLNVLCLSTAEYYTQPYVIRQVDAVSMSDDGKNILNTIPKVSHKKLQKEIKENPNDYLFYLSDIGKFDDFIEYCFYDLDKYNGDNSDKKYNRNINYSNILADGKALFSYEINKKLYSVIQRNGVCGSVATIDFKDITIPVKVTIDNITIKLDAYDIYCEKNLSELIHLINIHKENNKKDEEVEPVDGNYGRKIYIIINETIGKIQYAPETRFSSLEDFVSVWGGQELKRSFNRGDKFQVLEYVCKNKSEYKNFAFDCKYARAFRTLNLKKTEFDRVNLVEMYNEYTDSVWENYDQSLFIKNDIQVHLSKVYSRISDYTKNIKQKTEQEFTCPVEQLILNNFSEDSFKQSWHNVLFNSIVTDQKVFLKKAGLNKVLLSFSLYAIRMNDETRRRVSLIETDILLVNQTGLYPYSSINKIFQRGKSLPPVKQVGEVAMVAVVNKNRSQGNIQISSAIKDSGSHDHINDDDYLTSLMTYANNLGSFDEPSYERWTV